MFGASRRRRTSVTNLTLSNLRVLGVLCVEFKPRYDDLCSKQGVDEGRGAGAAEDDEHAEQQQQYYHRLTPPLLVVADEIPELTEESAGLAFGLVREVVSIVFNAHKGSRVQSCLKYRSGLDGSQSTQYDFADRSNRRRIGSGDRPLRDPDRLAPREQ